MLSVGAGIVLAAAGWRLIRRGLVPSAVAGRWSSPIVLGLFLYQAVFWARWIPERAHTIPEMGRDLVERTGPTAVVSPGGSYSLESELRFDSSAVRALRMFDATGGTSHFVVLAAHPTIGALPRGEIERRFPGSRFLNEYELTGGYVYLLYEAAGARSAP